MIDNQEVKFCADCKHSRYDPYSEERYKCAKSATVSLVDGTRILGCARINRHCDESCGTGARWFEPIEPIEPIGPEVPKYTLTQKIKDFFK